MFTRRTLQFLRALKRHNDRTWFAAHREEYEQHVRAPMIALVERLAGDFARFAPELVATPKASIFRIYRDTRFSHDKSPFKTQVSARFPCRLLARGAGAGLYLEVAPQWVWMGGGFYAPEPHELALVRHHLAEHPREFAKIVGSAAFRRTFGRLQGERLQRVPRGFPPDHPAAEFLKHRQLYAGCERPASFAHSDAFYSEVVAVFRRVLPLVRFLNAPLIERPREFDAAGDKFLRVS
jgi:uncharacterized protein (TIGR02453 family)